MYIDDEKTFKAELAKHGYVQVFSTKYVGISFVGGVHEIYLHEKGVLAYFNFETGQFEVGESFGKKPAKAAKEDAMEKNVRRALLCAIVSNTDVLEDIKYAASKFDCEGVDGGKSEMIEFDFDDYDNQDHGRARANTSNDLFNIIGDILTLPLLPHPKGIVYNERIFLTPVECNFFCDEAKADATLKERKEMLEQAHPAFFGLALPAPSKEVKPKVKKTIKK